MKSAHAAFLLIPLIGLLPGRLEAQVSNTFNTGLDSWLVDDVAAPYDFPLTVAQTYTPNWSATGGNPDGYTSMTDPSGIWFFFSAPTPYLGNKLPYYGGTITYDLQCDRVSPRAQPGIVLVGETAALFYDISPPPPGSWANFSVPLTPSGWRVNDYLSGPEPTVSQMKSVLSNVKSLYISGDRLDGGVETAGLDNVSMSPSSQPVVPTQVVVLDWEHDVQFNPRCFTSLFGTTFWAANIGNPMPSPTDVAFEYKQAIKDKVIEIFTSSGVNNIVITDTLTPGATVVNFTDAEFRNGIGRSIQGFTITGIDRFNKHPDDNVLVSLRVTPFGSPPDSRGSPNYIADVVAHEIGHTLGLKHVKTDDFVDPQPKIEVMLKSVDDVRDQPRFLNAVSPIDEIFNSWPLPSHNHNPLYHLKRYVDGESHEYLVSQSIPILPGDYDQIGIEMLLAHFDFGDAARVIHNVYVLTGDSADSSTVLSSFESISLSDLSLQEFTIDAGNHLQLFASSVSGGLVDIVLSTGDPYDEENSFIEPIRGNVVAYLQGSAIGLG